MKSGNSEKKIPQEILLIHQCAFKTTARSRAETKEKNTQGQNSLISDVDDAVLAIHRHPGRTVDANIGADESLPTLRTAFGE